MSLELRMRQINNSADNAFCNAIDSATDNAVDNTVDNAVDTQLMLTSSYSYLILVYSTEHNGL
jgi:hypothetical protein